MTWVAVGVTAAATAYSAYSANQASKTQAAAANRAADIQQQQWEASQQQQQPYRTSGYAGLNYIAGMLPGESPTYDMQGNYAGQTKGSGYLLQTPEEYKWYPEYQTFGPKQLTENLAPGYAFRLKQGQGQVGAAANLAGGTMSGNTFRGLQDYTQNFASNEYGNALKQYMDQYALGLNSHIAQSAQSFNQSQTGQTNIYNRLASLAGLGQTSLGQTTGPGVVSAGQVGSNIVNAGSAQAGGQVGMANAVTGGVNTLSNLYLADKVTGGKIFGGGSTSLAPQSYSSGGSPSMYQMYGSEGGSGGGFGIRPA